MSRDRLRDQKWAMSCEVDTCDRAGPIGAEVGAKPIMPRSAASGSFIYLPADQIPNHARCGLQLGLASFKLSCLGNGGD